MLVSSFRLHIEPVAAWLSSVPSPLGTHAPDCSGIWFALVYTKSFVALRGSAGASALGSLSGNALPKYACAARRATKLYTRTVSYSADGTRGKEREQKVSEEQESSR